MSSKEQQLSASSALASDLRTVRALQRRHAALERELEPLREKVHTVTLLADSWVYHGVQQYKFTIVAVIIAELVILRTLCPGLFFDEWQWQIFLLSANVGRMARAIVGPGCLS